MMSARYATTEIDNAPSLFWSGSGFKGKGGWDPSTCLVQAGSMMGKTVADSATKTSKKLFTRLDLQDDFLKFPAEQYFAFDILRFDILYCDILSGIPPQNTHTLQMVENPVVETSGHVMLALKQVQFFSIVSRQHIATVTIHFVSTNQENCFCL